MQLSILLPIYGITIVILSIIAVLMIWHMFRFGEQTFVGFFVTLIFIIGIVFIFFFTYTLLRGTRWDQTLIDIPGKPSTKQSL